MRLIHVGLAALLVAGAMPARAELLRATRPSVMCSSAGALAVLGLPGGGSRDIGDHVPPAIAKISRDGGCADFPEGYVVVVQKARAHTSIVRGDSLTGDGVMIDTIVANIDFAPYLPPHDVFFDIIRARCPSLLEGIAAEDPPVHAFIDSLPAPVRADIGNVVEGNCEGQLDCVNRTRAEEVARRRLQERWAAFLCAHPAIAIEPGDVQAAPVRD